MQVVRVTREHHPPERSLAFAEQRADVLGHESRNLECVGDAGVTGLGTDVVAVVEGDRSATLEREHRLHMGHDTRHGPLYILRGRPRSQRGSLFDGEPERDVPVEGVVCRRLVGEHVRNEPSPCQLGQHVGAVANQADGQRASRALGLLAPAKRFIQGRRRTIQVARLDSPMHSRGIHFDGQTHAVVHGRGERLSASHTAEATRQHETSAQRPAEVPARHGAERLVRTL